MNHDVHSEQFGKHFMKNLPCQLFDQHHQVYLNFIYIQVNAWWIYYYVTLLHFWSSQ